MHEGEQPIDAALVRRLVEAQFPQWAALPVVPVRSAGTDNAIYRVGDDLAARLPRIDWAVGQAEKELAWLPRLAPHLPLAIPAVVALGEPGEGYPWPWSVHRWLPGEPATPDRLADEREAATVLASFVAALQRVDATGAPRPGARNSGRGAPLRTRERETRVAIAELDGTVDTERVSAAWDAALAEPEWRGAPVWIHGDLQSGNLLAVDGRLSAVIDFGCLGAGDPAADAMAAWLYLSAGARAAFRAALPLDDATWARGRGWALSVSLVALPYYRTTNPVLAGIAQRAIDEVLADQSGSQPSR